MLSKIFWGLLLVIVTAGAVMIAFGIFKQSIKYEIAHTPWSQTAMTNPAGTITLVEFVDYSCPYCDQFSPLVHAASKDNKEINIILRPIALLGEESEAIASLIIAADDFKKSIPLHYAIINRPESPSERTTLEEAAKLGIDINELQKIAASDKVNKILKTNKAIHRALGFREIPALLINKTPYTPTHGMPTAGALKQIINEKK